MLGIPFLESAITKLFKTQTFDDPIDRLNYFITPTLLAFFALLVSAKQYVGSPIQCWMPMEFKGGWEQYAEDYCFIQNTYYVSPEEEIPAQIDERQGRQFGYYQWVPIMLALQAVMFYLPNWLWKTLHQQSGLDLSTAISDAQDLRSLPGSVRSKEMNKLTTYVNEALEVNELHRSPRQLFCFRFGRSLGSYVSMLYLITKLLYLLNVFGQFWLLNAFIGRGYTIWGWTALKSLWTGQGWEDSPIFPRVSLCDFRVRRLANMHRYTVQCVLMINLFNEKIYLFLWFWFLFVGLSTIINFVYCVSTMVPPSARQRSIRKLLKQAKLQELLEADEAGSLMGRFTNHALRPDGVLLLRFIEGHAGAIVARDLCAKLFTDYLQRFDTLQCGSTRGDGSEIVREPYIPPFKREIMPLLGPPGSHSTKSTSPGGMDDVYVVAAEKSNNLEQPDKNNNDPPPAFPYGLKPKHV